MLYIAPTNIRAIVTASKWITGIVLFVAWTLAVWFFSTGHTQTACDLKESNAQLASTNETLDQSEGLRIRDGQYFQRLQGASDAFTLNTHSNDLSLADAQRAGDGLRIAITKAVKAGTCSLPDRDAAERASQAASAIGAAFAACDSEQREMAKGFAEALNRGQACQQQHEPAVTQPVSSAGTPASGVGQ